MDWAVQVPYTLFALRQSSNRDTGISPYEMVYGFNVRTLLDALYHCWVEEKEVNLNASEWEDVVQERLDLVRDVASRRMKEAVVQRKKAYDKCSKIRMFDKGDMVMYRVPGLCHKLQESWTGPFGIVERLNRVNYKVIESDGKSSVKKKQLKALCGCVNRLTVVASEEKDDRSLVAEDIRELLSSYEDVLSEIPGQKDTIQIKIEVEYTSPIQNYTKV